MTNPDAQSAARPGPRGFTLIELMVVMTIIGILVGIALPQFRASILQAREAVLKEDLFRMRQAIDQYYADKGRYPVSLEALVEDGYLRQLQADPITRAVDWVVVPAEVESSSTSSEPPGVYDVRSAAGGNSSNGTPYSEW